MNVTNITTGSITNVSNRVDDARRAASPAGSAADLGPASVSDVSDGAKMLSELSALKSSDPEKFQATMKDMADHLRAEAKSQGGEAATFLGALADKVTEAAKTGDLSKLTPPPGARPGSAAAVPSGLRRLGGPGGPHGVGGGPGRPHGAAPPAGAGHAEAKKGSTTTKSATDPTRDPADTDGNGVVSEKERAAYDAAHPRHRATSVEAKTV